jgi:hypothetical protein
MVRKQSAAEGTEWSKVGECDGSRSRDMPRQFERVVLDSASGALKFGFVPSTEPRIDTFVRRMTVLFNPRIQSVCAETVDKYPS